MPYPTPEEFRQILKRKKALRKELLKQATTSSDTDSGPDPLTPLVIIAIYELKEDGKKAIEVRDVVRSLQDANIKTALDIYKVAQRILNSLGLKMTKNFPTVYAMPEVLPPIEEAEPEPDKPTEPAEPLPPPRAEPREISLSVPKELPPRNEEEEKAFQAELDQLLKDIDPSDSICYQMAEKQRKKDAGET